jgi:hypothetical protein
MNLLDSMKKQNVPTGDVLLLPYSLDVLSRMGNW